MTVPATTAPCSSCQTDRPQMAGLGADGAGVLICLRCDTVNPSGV